MDLVSVASKPWDTGEEVLVAADDSGRIQLATSDDLPKKRP